jgi:hypothetical protein
MDTPTLTAAERDAFLDGAARSLHAMLPLVRYRNACRAAGIANREVPGPNAGRLAFARYRYQHGRMAEWAR